MRIHSDTLHPSDFYKVVRDLPGVSVDVIKHGSRARSVAYEVRLTGTSSRRTMDNMDQAATWDEWGVFFARIFDMDRDALAGSIKYPAYDGATDYHRKTGRRFVGLTMPRDTHQQHRWELDLSRGVLACTKCSAYRPRF
jgi:hypothetical protein